MDVSIIIVTRNRAADLKATLLAILKVEIPEGLKVELLVVDNASTDGTSEVVKLFGGDGIAVRHSFEPRIGKTIGLNRGLAETTGRAILFTDDDVRPPVNWITGMCGPILRGDAMAVCGGVKLAAHLRRDWMTLRHRSWLASTEWLGSGTPQSMVGANMAFSRDVVRRVPGFDPELGPGALGFGDDHLFASQLLAAGYRIHDRRDLCTEHHCDPTRLGRQSWLDLARKMGASHAYIGHHWEHWRCRFGRMKVLRAQAHLAAWNLRNGSNFHTEGCAPEEMDLVFQLALARAHLKESTRARNYERQGLMKL